MSDLLCALCIVAGSLCGFLLGALWHEWPDRIARRVNRRSALDLDGRWRRWADDKGRR